MTLIKLLLGLAATGMIGAAIASMLAAVSYGTDSSHDIRDIVVQGKTISTRMNAAIRESCMVLDSGDDYLVLWTGDRNNDQVPSTQELQRIEYDRDAREIVSYTATASAEDTAYALDDDFDSVTQSLENRGDLQGETWGRSIAGLSLTLDDSDAQAASLVSFRVTLTTGTVDEITIGAAALRN